MYEFLIIKVINKEGIQIAWRVLMAGTMVYRPVNFLKITTNIFQCQEAF